MKCSRFAKRDIDIIQGLFLFFFSFFFSNLHETFIMADSEPNPLIVFATIVAIIGSFIALYFLQKTKKDAPVLSPQEYKKFPLIEKHRVSHNSCVYKFGLPRSTDKLNLPIGQHISISAIINGKEVVRSYTPISNNDQLGSFDLLIKTYENGNISKYVESKKIGEHIDIRGPKGFFTYTPNMVKSFGMVAGGTGIAPMYQILTAVLNNPEDKTKIHLVYANVSEEDILLRAELEELKREHPDQFFIHYVLNNPPENWKGSVGFVTPEIMDEHLPKHSDDTNLLICGPPLMVSAIKKAAQTLGYPKAKPVSKLGDQVFVF
ncbi:hypothetical protein QG37_02087 [Candidozyma auris]|uniref:NADH-cytochrome b5 reductase n=3 Tax=Candidozyma auris TaxID=498019 RepID=A0A0L0P494_CANAR|nr:hypothetical protein QG37_02087 [[Candida] auris]